MSVCPICSAHPCLRVSSYTSGFISVSPSQKIKLYIDNPTHNNPNIMSDQLPNEYWESLGQNGLFLWSLFQGQHEQLQQLKELNAFLQSRVTDTRDDITNVASAMASAVAQAIIVVQPSI